VTTFVPSLMGAANLHAVADLRYETVPVPEPKADEALVRIEASGICGSDLPRVRAKGTYHFPTIPGHEFAGTVVDCPSDPARIGQRITVFPLIPCGRCAMCEIGEYASCADYDYYGSRRDGGFAQYQAIKVANLIPVPEEVSSEDAAMIEPCAVAVHALSAAPFQLGDWLAIWGAGPIGLMAAQLAAARGTRVVLVDIDQRKLDVGRALGFTDAVNPGQVDAPAVIRELTGGGADICLEAAGVSATLAGCLESTRPFGHVILMGNLAGDMRLVQSSYWQVLRKQLRLAGVWNSSHNQSVDDWATAITAVERGQVTPSILITHRFPLAECNEAFRVAASPEKPSLKVMFTPHEATA
jgi:L-iditol 2-dehydrogenase